MPVPAREETTAAPGRSPSTGENDPCRRSSRQRGPEMSLWQKYDPVIEVEGDDLARFVPLPSQSCFLRGICTGPRKGNGCRGCPCRRGYAPKAETKSDANDGCAGQPMALLEPRLRKTWRKNGRCHREHSAQPTGQLTVRERFACVVAAFDGCFIVILFGPTSISLNYSILYLWFHPV